jgi:hypothetical protein
MTSEYVKITGRFAVSFVSRDYLIRIRSNIARDATRRLSCNV